MSAHELNDLLAAAEQAAAADDYASAERLLRDAAAVQERDLGSAHPDLANTLNNLGVVCERAGRADDAESCYRRAYAIATEALPPDHPFVATSRKNLEDLCQQLGRAFDVPVAVPEPLVDPPQAIAPLEPTLIELARERSKKTHAADAEPREPRDPDPAPLAPVLQPSLRLQLDPSAAPVKAPTAVAVPPEIAKKHDADRERTRALPVGAAIIVAISLVIVLIGWLAWPSSGAGDRPDQAATGNETGATAETPGSSASASATPAPAAPTASAPSAPERAPREPSSNAAAAPTIADARLCQKLSTSGVWQCDPLAGPVSSGTIYFYTRIVTLRATQVQHRWYQGDRLRQSVMLDVQANPSGYRTFSRTTVGPDRAGEWRVELRAPDGRMLREERFTVGASR